MLNRTRSFLPDEPEEHLGTWDPLLRSCVGVPFSQCLKGENPDSKTPGQWVRPRGLANCSGIWEGHRSTRGALRLGVAPWSSASQICQLYPPDQLEACGSGAFLQEMRELLP